MEDSICDKHIVKEDLGCSTLRGIDSMLKVHAMLNMSVEGYLVLVSKPAHRFAVPQTGNSLVSLV